MDAPDTPLGQVPEAQARDRADRLWQEMPSHVRFVLRRRLGAMNPIDALKEVGRHHDGIAWSVTPCPGSASGFGTLGRREAKRLFDKLRGGDD